MLNSLEIARINPKIWDRMPQIPPWGTTALRSATGSTKPSRAMRKQHLSSIRDVVVCTPAICSGSPRIRDTRLTCANIIEALAFSKVHVSTYLAWHESLSLPILREAVKYCAERQCISDKPLHYCQGCILDDRTEIKPGGYLAEGSIELDPQGAPGVLFAGTQSEYEESSQPIEMWIHAAALLQGNTLR